MVEESSVKENEINTTEQESVVATTEMESSVDEMGTKCEPMKESDAKDFWIDGNTYLIKMRYVMDGEESFFDSDGTAQIHKEREYKDGLIYNIIINSNDGNVKNRSMAHFYVENEKIYIVDDYDNNKKIKDDYLQLVYQQKDIENELTPLTVLHPHYVMLLSISVINHQRIFQDDSLCIQEVSFEYLDDSDRE